MANITLQAAVSLKLKSHFINSFPINPNQVSESLRFNYFLQHQQHSANCLTSIRSLHRSNQLGFLTPNHGESDSNPLVKIKNIDARPLNVPLLAPFSIATTTLRHVSNVGVRIELTDGSVGWGEVPTLPSVTQETQPEALNGTTKAGEWLLSQPFSTWQNIAYGLSEFMPGHRHASVRAGIEMALVDAVAKSTGKPLWLFFGGNGNEVLTDITIPICSPSEAADLAKLYQSRGFEIIKIKVGNSIEEDIERLHAIRSVHPHCKLIVDANGGFTKEEAMKFVQTLNEQGLNPTLLEQPVHRNDWSGLGHVTHESRERFGISVAADESCRSPNDAKKIVHENLSNVINIKLAKVGVLGALHVASIAKSNGLELMIGGMVETRLAMGFAAHLAAGLGVFSYIDLDTPLLLAEDPVRGGYLAEGPLYKLGNVPGHGGSLVWN